MSTLTDSTTEELAEEGYIAVPEAEWEAVQDRLDRVEGELDNQATNVTGAFAKISDIDDRLTSVEEGDDTDETHGVEDEDHADDDAPQTPMEQIAALPEHVAEDQLTPNQRRARFVAKDVDQYGKSVPVGTRMDTTTLRKVLQAASEESERIYRTTTHRVMDFLDRFGEDDVTLKKKRGRKFVIFSEELIERLKQLKRSDVCYGDQGSGLLRAV